MASPLIFILGAGPRIGQGVARAFASQGYRIAVSSRSTKESENTANKINIQSDLSYPSSVVRAFAKVKAVLGIPSVVVYNAGAATANDPKNPLSLPLADFTKDLAINTTSAFVPAQQAVLAFEQLPESASRAFIYTGNALNTTTFAPVLDLGVGKSATAHIIESAAAAYKEKGFKFHYGDERKADGSPAFSIDAEAHGKLYPKLTEANEQKPWQQTFVNGEGYKKF